MHSSVVVHEVVGGGLGYVVLGLMVHYLVVHFPLGALQLLVTYFVRICLGMDKVHW